VAKPTKVLIIKTGYSETFTPEISDVVSLGDVFRTTALLHLYKGQHVTWLTAEKAIPLLQDNPYITELLPYNLTNVLKLQDEQFDIVINLEKVPGLCALGDRVRAWQRYGYRFDPRTGRAEAYLESTEALYIANNEDRKKESEKHWLELLLEIIGMGSVTY
jgi:heptosyltransferase-2